MVRRPGRWSFRSDRHAITYLGLFLFSFVVWFRPYELIPALSGLTSLALALGVFTLLVYVPSQIALEGNATAWLREVKLVLLLAAAGFLSLPLALSRGEAWAAFSGTFIKAVLIFVVMVNVVRSERRLLGLILISLAVGVYLSVGALIDARTGQAAMEGYRVAGRLGGMFLNPNDLAIHLVMMIPIAVALCLSAGSLPGKAVYGAGAVLMVAATVFTYSRGGFLALACAVGVLAWKLGRRLGPSIWVAVVLGGVAFLALAPGDYAGRLASILDPSLDIQGSADIRRGLLWRSIEVALRNPVFGVGMGSFHILSIHEYVTHNAYTQVAAEMGLPALVFYLLFLISPLRRLRQVEGATLNASRERRTYYLAVGLQAGLVGYMVASFFASVAYQWYVYYMAAYAVCLHRIFLTRLSDTAAPSPSRRDRMRAARRFSAGKAKKQSFQSRRDD